MSVMFSGPFNQPAPVSWPARVSLWLVRAVVFASALVVALALLSAAMVWLVWGVLKAVVTGQKPTLWTAFDRYRQFTAQRFTTQRTPRPTGGISPGQRGGGRHQPNEVVDVTDVKVVRDQPGDAQPR